MLAVILAVGLVIAATGGGTPFVNSSAFGVIIGLVVGAVGAVFTYFRMRRTTSGKIGTSDAESLWKESQDMRRELRDEVAALRKENEEQEKEMQVLRRRVLILENTLRSNGVPIPHD